MPHFVPQWLVVDRPRSISTMIRKNTVSLISRILTKKDAADSVPANVQLDRDLDKAVSTALARGVHINTVISALESQEQSARSRLVSAHRFGPTFVSGNLPD
jgi:hypothetical protein